MLVTGDYGYRAEPERSILIEGEASRAAPYEQERTVGECKQRILPTLHGVEPRGGGVAEGGLEQGYAYEELARERHEREGVRRFEVAGARRLANAGEEVALVYGTRSYEHAEHDDAEECRRGLGGRAQKRPDGVRDRNAGKCGHHRGRVARYARERECGENGSPTSAHVEERIGNKEERSVGRVGKNALPQQHRDRAARGSRA